MKKKRCHTHFGGNNERRRYKEKRSKVDINKMMENWTGKCWESVFSPPWTHDTALLQGTGRVSRTRAAPHCHTVTCPRRTVVTGPKGEGCKLSQRFDVSDIQGCGRFLAMSVTDWDKPKFTVDGCEGQPRTLSSSYWREPGLERTGVGEESPGFRPPSWAFIP